MLILILGWETVTLTLRKQDLLVNFLKTKFRQKKFPVLDDRKGLVASGVM